MKPWLLPSTCVGVVHALGTLVGRPEFLDYKEAGLPQRELSNDICNDNVHVILQNGPDCSGDSAFLYIGGV